MRMINAPPTAEGPEDAGAQRPDSDAYADLEGEGDEERWRRQLYLRWIG